MARNSERFRSLLLTWLACAALCAPGCAGAGTNSSRAEDAHWSGSGPEQPGAMGSNGALVAVRYTGPEAPSIAEGATPPPIDLVTPDGSRLGLRSLVAHTVVEGPLAFTELRLTFVNPEARQVEGRFQITLPTAAAISRFAMRIGNSWQEGEVVEQRHAREAYEDFLHRKQDPALLERAAGNVFAARVFPIAANADKELVLSYSQELTEQQTTLVPMRGLAKVERVDVSVNRQGESAQLAGYQKAAYQPTEDFGLELGSVRTADGLRNGELVVARISPPVAAEPAQLTSAVILVDTSGSRALGLAAELRMVQALASHVAARGGADAPLVVATFDQATTPVFAGRASGLGSEALSTIAKRGALGASDLEGALHWAANAARQSGARRVVVLSDGVATAGKTDAADIRRTVAALRQSNVERLDAIGMGGIRDQESLAELVAGGLAHDGIVLDGDRGASELGRLDAPTASRLPVAVAGATWSWPKELRGVQPGDSVLVYAELPPGRPLQLSVGNRSVAAPELVAVARPLLERSWARAKISSLLARQADGAAKSDTRRQIIALSTRHRVLSPYTSLLVLETEWDYRRFQIDRNALADILTIEGGQLRHLHRPSATPPKAPPAGVAQQAAPATVPAPALTDPRLASPEPLTAARATATGAPVPADLETQASSARGSMWGDAIGESFGAGGLALSGIGEGGGGRGESLASGGDSRGEGLASGGGGRGEGIGLGSAGTIGRGAGASPDSGSGQGFGSGHGRIGRSHRAAVPQVRMGATSVSGRLPPEVIQRIVRMRFGRLRACYERGLARNPALQGRLVVRFLIDRSGHVAGADATASSLPDAAMVQCAVQEFRAMTFPAPEGGNVTVTYPVVFAPAGSVLDAPEEPAPPAAPTEAIARTNPPQPPAPKPAPAAAQGPLGEVLRAIEQKRVGDALAQANGWHAREPGEVLALVALGRAYEAAGAPEQAARAYGSIIDLFPWRADQRRFAGGHLEHVGLPAALDLALDSFQKAQEQRPDHPSSHRMLAIAWLKKGQPAKAFDVLQAALARRYPDGRFAGVERVLRGDLALAAAAWLRAEPKRADDIQKRLDAVGVEADTEASLRFVLSWETDSNDVDLHVYDEVGGHAYYGDRTLPSGGDLYADVTTGYGPECFAVQQPSKERSGSYRVKVQYYAQGPMGYGMGKVEVVHHDGHGGLRFEERPFVVMNGGSEIDLGAVGI